MTPTRPRDATSGPHVGRRLRPPAVTRCWLRRVAGLALALLLSSGCGEGTGLDTEPPDTGAALPGAGCEGTLPFGLSELKSLPEVACGIQDDGSYLGPCDLEYGPGWRSTLCDEALGRCVAPERCCDEGWCYLPPRSFLAGAGPDRGNITEARDAAIVDVPRGFYAQETEVTVGAFEALMGYVPQDTPPCGDDCPVGGVTFFEAMEYANRLGDLNGLERCYELHECRFETLVQPTLGTEHRTWTCEWSDFAGPKCTGFRLPSRAEWELAAGAGSPFCLPRETAWWAVAAGGCNLLPEVAEWARYCGNSDSGYRPCHQLQRQASPDGSSTLICVGPVPVRGTAPNAFGLFEVFGSVAEMTQTAMRLPSDPSEKRSEGPYEFSTEPEFSFVVGRDDSVYVMGGSFDSQEPHPCRWTAHGLSIRPNALHLKRDGFRLVRTALEPPAP